MASTVRRKWLRIIGITGISLLLLLGGLHFWFSRNAARYLEGIVATQSNGNLQLKVKGFSFNYLTGFVEVRQGNLISMESTANAATYNIRLDRLTLHIQSFWPLLFQRRLLLDSMLVHNPRVEIYRWRKDSSNQRDLVSLPAEMGRLYQSLLDGLDAMELKHISIRKAGFILYNRIRPERPPVSLTGVDFSLNYRPGQTDSTARDRYLPGVQNVSLLIPEQGLVLPDGRHKLAFKKIELELFRQRLQLDSCTISTIDGQARRADFDLFFKQLLLTGVDFDALYRQNMVRADSVFCLAPMFQIDINNRVKKDTAVAIKTPDLQEVLNDLAGNFDLKFVGVKEAGFNVVLNGAKKRTLSNDRRDDFSMHGLRVKPDSTEPLSVQEFDMNVRGYSLYNEDSSTVYHFDSIQLRNSRLVLRQFTATTTARSNPGRSIRRYRIPYFELQGIDWEALLFEEQLKAQQATLGEPDIYFKAGRRQASRKKVSLFEALQTAEDQLSLQKVTVRNGRMHLLPANGTEIKLADADMVIQTASLLQARSEAGIKQSVEQLHFDQGTVQLGAATVQLRGVDFTEKSGLLVQNLSLTSKGAKAQLQGVSLRDLIFDKQTNNIEAQDLSWRSGTVQIAGLIGGGQKGGGGASSFLLRNISGNNTRVLFEQRGTRVQTVFSSLGATRLSKPAGGKLSVDGLNFATAPLSFSTPDLSAHAQSVRLAKDGRLQVQQLVLNQVKNKDSLYLQVPRVSALVDVADLVNGNMQVPQLILQQPEIRMQQHLPKPANNGTPALSLQLASVRLEEPQVSVTIHKGDSLSRFELPRSDGGLLQVNDVAIAPSGISVGKIALQSGPAWFTQPNGVRMGTEKGSARIVLSQLKRSLETGKPAWSGVLDSVSLLSPNAFTFGKGSRLLVSEASGGNLVLQTGGLGALLRNPSAWIRTGTATYRDSNTVLHWEGARYEAGAKTLSLDSFSARPARSREVTIASTPYQIDYVTFTSGPVKLTGFDRDKLERDSAFTASTIQLQRPVITIYRDKRPPFRSGINKPLPVNAIKAIRMPVDVGQVVLQNGLVVYTELAEKSNEEGIISLTNLNARIGNIRNRNLSRSDSLSLRIDALLLDSAQLSLNLKESYTDSLAGFLMHLRMKPTSLTFLNPVVAPLASVQIESGTVDSLYLNAIGREDVAFGEMHLFYRNLRIKFVQVGENSRSKVLLRLMTTLANTFFIRKNNNGRESLMYFERLRDRSFFNYIVKMTMSGLASGVGVKKNKKALRQYREELELLRGHPFEE
ncbi:hypothetical protein [Pseudocnuella soli]|uniref:hypothetical protein n=1 Tax=Pseudocnuella soli TaxID=2502779 RepID=UPI001046656F|nr:hypothetical protein [Pseudocnuella soli]